MLNRIALTSLCLFIGLSVFAQSGSKWKIGFKAGWNYTDQLVSKLTKSGTFNANKTYNQSTQWLLGGHFGLSSSLQLSEKVVLNADFILMQTGFKVAILDTLVEDKLTNRLYYAGLPIYGSILILPKLGFEIGIQPSYLLGRVGRFNGELVENIGKDAFSNLDFGLIGGLSYQINERFKFQSRYYRGMSNSFDVTFTDINGQPVTPEPKFINHGIQVSLTVFPF